MEKIWLTSDMVNIKYPIIYWVSYMSGSAGFLSTTIGRYKNTGNVPLTIPINNHSLRLKPCCWEITNKPRLCWTPLKNLELVSLKFIRANYRHLLQLGTEPGRAGQKFPGCSHLIDFRRLKKWWPPVVFHCETDLNPYFPHFCRANHHHQPPPPWFFTPVRRNARIVCHEGRRSKADPI